jgi:hypothetical protein
MRGQNRLHESSGHQKPTRGSFPLDSTRCCKQRQCVPASSPTVYPYHIPELHRPVTRTRRKGLSIRTPCYAIDIPNVSLQVGQQFTRDHIPALHGPVTRTRRKGLSIRTTRYAIDIPNVSLQGCEQFARGGFSEVDRPVTGTRGNGLPIRTPRYAQNPVSVSAQAGQQFTRGNLP